MTQATNRILETDPRAVALIAAIRHGRVEALAQQLRDDPQIATIRIVDERGVSRTPLHVLTDWPGHFPHGDRTAALLIAAGTDIDAPVGHPGPTGSPETALHWAASSNDVAVLDALLDGGADLEAPGAVFTGGTPLSDAVVFAQWNAARRLVERGATTTIWQAAALGLVERVQALFESQPAPDARAVTNALWHACRGGQRATAELLLHRGADINWIGYDGKTPLDAAHDDGHAALSEWLTAQGGKRSTALA